MGRSQIAIVPAAGPRAIMARNRSTGMLDLDRIRGLLAARKPGHSLPQAFYKDPDIFAFDLAAIYSRSWIMIGFDIELPEPGSYLALTIGESPIIVLRDRDG